jgi:catechol 2,3-dioxygenase-like lactoylglutathione lyase family enzyme
MFTNSMAFSGFSVDDLAKAKDFYGKTLGIEILEDNAMGVMTLRLATGASVVVYPKGPAHSPATYTVLNFPVDDIERAVDRLRSKGITFEKYDNIRTDEKGIHRDGGPLIAWFRDPAGNILSVMQHTESGR